MTRFLLRRLVLTFPNVAVSFRAGAVIETAVWTFPPELAAAADAPGPGPVPA